MRGAQEREAKAGRRVATEFGAGFPIPRIVNAMHEVWHGTPLGEGRHEAEQQGQRKDGRQGERDFPDSPPPDPSGPKEEDERGRRNDEKVNEEARRGLLGDVGCEPLERRILITEEFGGYVEQTDYGE